MKGLFKSSLIIGYVAVLAIFTGCKDDEVTPLVIPTEYDGASFSANSTTELSVSQQLGSITAEAKKGRTNGKTVSATALSDLFTAGSPSLKAVATTYYAGKLEGTSGFLNQLALASGGTYTPGTPTGNGGTFGGYLFDENGLEIEQLIEKGQFGAVLFNHAASLLSGPLTNETTDKVIAIFGANPSFPNSSDGSKHETPDKFAAVYAARRDKNDGNGFYTTLKANFVKLQAAIKAGNDYKNDQQAAIKAIKENWEKANGATIINYSHVVISTLSATNPNDTQKANALHAYGECVGFVLGWRTISQEHKIITDAQIDELLTLLNAPADGTPTSYKFVTDSVNELPKLQQVIAKLKSIYGFSDQQVEDFKKNWVAEQAR
jgi:hypothetical protein